ncbi:MAG: recombinase family protein [Desulfobacterales bacterium]|nr:MAG: recombinase family protein [Desulfobacterales bacterium]
MKTIEQRRKADRERLKRWRKKKLADGNKQIQLMLTPEAQKILIREKERTGEPYVHIINRAIIYLEQGRPDSLDTTSERPPEQQKIIRRIRQLWSEGYTYSAIADIFNSEGLTTFKDSNKWQASLVLELDTKG